ncbi:MAG: hypothetical protein ACYCX9_10660 [Candidatus Dormibacteria bacterium]
MIAFRRRAAAPKWCIIERMTQRHAPRARRSTPAQRPLASGGAETLSGGGWATEIALVIALVALLSALANVVAVLVVSATMATATPPEGSITYLPVVAGAVIGLAGDALLLSGALGVLRPGVRFSSGRGAVLVGLAVQVVAAAAVGTLEASWMLTLVYLVLLAALAALWLRFAPQPGPRPLAQHPIDEGERRRIPVPPSGRWIVQGAPQPMTWSGGVPLPPSAPGEQTDESLAVSRPAAPATWKRPER